jgi:hypothetical protein
MSALSQLTFTPGDIMCPPGELGLMSTVHALATTNAYARSLYFSPRVTYGQECHQLGSTN